MYVPVVYSVIFLFYHHQQSNIANFMANSRGISCTVLFCVMGQTNNDHLIDFIVLNYHSIAHGVTNQVHCLAVKHRKIVNIVVI